ncbi:hypothetical protein C8F01DRAFT_1106290 [Mycena amicta]|nr:hypothetical protein C8F01DRAFT_1106290 [Mycena amicta]
MPLLPLPQSPPKRHPVQPKRHPSQPLPSSLQSPAQAHATPKPRQPWSTPPRNTLPPATAVASDRRRLPAVLTSNLHAQVAVETSNPLQAASMQVASGRLKFEASYSWSLGTTTTHATGYRDMRGIHLSPKLSPSAAHCLTARTVPLHAMRTQSEVCFPCLISGIDCRYGFLTIRNAVVQGQYQVGLRVVGPVLCIVHMC